jgi:hypothetical protein
VGDRSFDRIANHHDDADVGKRGDETSRDVFVLEIARALLTEDAS